VTDAILSLRAVTKRFGGLTALREVSFDVPAESVFGVIGPNGSGKTTLFNVVGGQLRPEGGRVLFAGHDVTGLPPERIARDGIGRTFQTPKLFTGLTVWGNVLVATHNRGKAGIVRSALRIPPIRHEERALAEIAREVLDFTGLTAVAGRRAGELTSGQMRLLEVARALAAGPRLVMLDEPAAGLTTAEVDVLAAKVASLPDRGITVLLIEHNMSFVMGLCERIVVLSDGTKLAEGTAGEVRADAGVVDAYLGRTGSS
jgi:branched-chain amino acid transport system ATP-binding protein